MPLDHNEIFVLLQKLKMIFNINYKTTVNISDEEIRYFMEEIFNKPGASEFLTPREVIRDFLNMLNILRQNPKMDKSAFLKDIIISESISDENLLDEIEEL